tara:strand:- start:22763 stop:23584 length:822 start_codon:yes stop_codon:yes gene_type:complete
MHTTRYCQGHIWLLSGTGEGPLIAKSLIKGGWKVTLSVVSHQASLSYEGISLEEIKVGPLEGVEGIVECIDQAQLLGKKFDWVIDATHPFAELISTYLENACQKLDQPLIRYARPMEDFSSANLINSFNELALLDLNNQRLLMAIGSRYLKEAVTAAQKGGANVFARVLPSSKSFKEALGSLLPSSQIALLRPKAGGMLGDLEIELCKKWSITGIVCRQSGGDIERLWRQVCKKENLSLWLISRPIYSDRVKTIENHEGILELISNMSNLKTL